MCLFVAPPSTFNAGKCELFPGQILGARRISALFSTLFKSFLERNFGTLCCLFVHVIISHFLNPHPQKGICLWIPAKYKPPYWKLSPPLDDNCTCLCLSLVYLWIFDHDSMRWCLISGLLAKDCLKIVQSKQGLKAGVQLGEDQKRHKPKWEPLWGYTVAAGSHNFCACVFYMALWSCSYLLLRMLNSSVKGLQGFIWCWQRETLCLFPLWAASWELGLVCVFVCVRARACACGGRGIAKERGVGPTFGECSNDSLLWPNNKITKCILWNIFIGKFKPAL